MLHFPFLKKTWLIIVIVLVVITTVVMVFTLWQVQNERISLSVDLEYRTRLLTESLIESVEPSFLSTSQTGLQKLLDKFANRQRLLGLAVYDSKAVMVASSANLPDDVISAATVPSQAMDQDKAVGDFIETASGKIYTFAEPLHQNGAVIGAFLVMQRAGYIDDTIQDIWRSNMLRLLVQAGLFSLVIVVVLRWVIYQPLIALLHWIQSVRRGDAGYSTHAITRNSFFSPLTKEISKMSANLVQARSAASEEARLRFQKLDSPWTSDRLKEFVKATLKDRKMFVISNREPYVHTKEKNEIHCSTPASGLITAIEPVMEACGGMWIAQGTGNADKETADNQGKIEVPTDEPRYTLKRLWLTAKEQKGFYIGFSNEALWPLCHMVHTRPIFRKEDWQAYRHVNGKFVQSLLAEVSGVEQPLILVQDYHLAILPKMIKQSRPDAQVSLFWHIPWPSAENFNICPWRKEILEGMLGADVIGFHTQQYCNNFMETVSKQVECMVDLEQFSITRDGHTTSIKPFPISIAFSNTPEKIKKHDSTDTIPASFDIKTKHLGLGVDRLDYTKGILERLKGVEFFFDMYPAYKGHFTFLQIAPLTREGVKKYQDYSEEVTAETNRINERFAVSGWTPIVLVKKHLSHKELTPLYRRADVCIISSLHDGMNLVAKEFVAARNDESGVLILSQFAGASRDLKGAIIINPYSAEETAGAIHLALHMPLLQQRSRMKKMRESVKNYNIYRWSAELIKTLTNVG